MWRGEAAGWEGGRQLCLLKGGGRPQGACHADGELRGAAGGGMMRVGWGEGGGEGRGDQ